MIKTIDATDFKETGVKLMEAIEKAVGDTQRLIIQPLPDQLQLTPAQYDELSTLAGFIPTADRKKRIYLTKYNAMEVEVKQ